VNVLIIDNRTFYLNSLKNLFSSHKITVIDWEKFKSHNLENYDLIVLSGGHPYSITHHPNLFKQEIEIVKSTTIPVLGICLGFEIIVYSFGGTLKELLRREKGILEIKAEKEDPIFGDIRIIEVFENHRWIAKKLPYELIALARSKDGVEVVKHKDRLIYGFQFHPEIVVDKNDLRIFNNFLKLVERS